MRRSPFAVAWLLALALVLCRTAVAQADDYDVQSPDWNGLQELVRVAQDTGVELRPTAVLDWADVRRTDGLLILYPLASVDRADLTSFLEDGGRLALLDDFGGAEPLFEWFRVVRSEDARGDARSAELPGLLVAYRRAEHPLTDGVDTLVTNEPVVLSHPRLSPVFALSDDPHQGIVLAGEVNNRGRLVIGGDPSVLINTMLRFPGNRQFARNLLSYLAGRPHGRVYLVHSHFALRGSYRGRNSSQSPSRELLRNLNEALARLPALAGDAIVVHTLAAVMTALALLAFALKAWGSKPSDRFGPAGPAGAAAATAEKVALFAKPRANMLYPSLIAKRYFERALLRAVGLAPPTDVGAVLARARGRLDELQQAELRALLVELDRLATPAEEGGPAKVSASSFLSLWRRIGAILTALGEAR